MLYSILEKERQLLENLANAPHQQGEDLESILIYSLQNKWVLTGIDRVALISRLLREKGVDLEEHYYREPLKRGSIVFGLPTQEFYAFVQIFTKENESFVKWLLEERFYYLCNYLVLFYFDEQSLLQEIEYGLKRGIALGIESDLIESTYEEILLESKEVDDEVEKTCFRLFKCSFLIGILCSPTFFLICLSNEIALACTVALTVFLPFVYFVVFALFLESKFKIRAKEKMKNKYTLK